MKDKVLRANLSRLIEGCSKELRSYSKDSMVLKLTIITKASGINTENKDGPAPDWYMARVVPAEQIDTDDSIIDESAKILYGYDHFGNEGILQVVPYKEPPEEGEEESEEQNE